MNYIMRGIKITQSITNRDDISLFLKDISKQPMISHEEEVLLAKKIKEGDIEARNKLVEANLRFVISVAKKYQNRGLSLADLIQAGIEGMIVAADKFDVDRGFKFISYAVWWIQQSILQALMCQSRTIRIPTSQSILLSKINKVIEHYEQEFGRFPSNEEIGEKVKLDPDKVSFLLSSINKAISLETPFKDEEAGCLLDIIPNENVERLDEELLKEDISKEIDNVLNLLSARESDVLRMSFGIGMPAMSIEQIAPYFGVGYERIRQIQHEAIERIKINYKDYLKELL